MAVGHIEHTGLRQLWQDGERRRLPADWVARLERILAILDDARSPAALAELPGIHRLTGNLAGYWAVRLTRQKRVIFRWDDASATASGIDIVDYH